ncbi:DUF883 family protein [Trinickia mobilis]|uniref:DUF883 family protein n=1 Tax=Trinickia mobilis TaxID=2816356 RepID=UPI001A8CE7EE|nr:DUF883 family protein [Trinickia mobilis]
MTALPNTKDAIGDSWSSTKRHARRIARHGRHAAEDIGGEMRDLLAELEQALTDGTHADAAVLRAQLKQRLDAARARLDGAQQGMRERATEVFADADDYVRENPWQAIAIVGGVALIAGALLARGR